jgi:hypothetical protein
MSQPAPQPKPLTGTSGLPERAYQLYVEKDRQDGYALDHWLTAEREI